MKIIQNTSIAILNAIRQYSRTTPSPTFPKIAYISSHLGTTPPPILQTYFQVSINKTLDNPQ